MGLLRQLNVRGHGSAKEMLSRFLCAHSRALISGLWLGLLNMACMVLQNLDIQGRFGVEHLISERVFRGLDDFGVTPPVERKLLMALLHT